MADHLDANNDVGPLDEDVYRKSLAYMSGTNRGAAFEGVDPPSVQQPTIYKKDNINDLLIPVCQQYLWLPSRKEINTGYRNRIDRIRQMELKTKYSILKVYTPTVASGIFLLLGLLLILFGVLLYTFTNFEQIEIPYDENNSGPITFNVPQSFKPPVYIYYKITDFYVAHKHVVYDTEPDVIAKNRCSTYKTFEEILDLRCIDGKNTLNGNHSLCSNYHNVPEFKLPAYPCGALAATIMTDNFLLCPSSANLRFDELGNLPEDAHTHCLKVSIQHDLNIYKFTTLTFSRQMHAGGFLWLDLSNPYYQSWLSNPHDNSFLKPYGVIYDEVPAGEYKLFVTTNLWPATTWNASKSIFIAPVHKWGTRATLFEIIIFIVDLSGAWGKMWILLFLLIFVCRGCGLYVLTGLCIFSLYRLGYKCNYSPWRELERIRQDNVKTTIVRSKSQLELKVAPDSDVPKPTTGCMCHLHNRK